VKFTSGNRFHDQPLQPGNGYILDTQYNPPPERLIRRTFNYQGFGQHPYMNVDGFYQSVRPVAVQPRAPTCTISWTPSQKGNEIDWRGDLNFRLAELQLDEMEIGIFFLNNERCSAAFVDRFAQKSCRQCRRQSTALGARHLRKNASSVACTTQPALRRASGSRISREHTARNSTGQFGIRRLDRCRPELAGEQHRLPAASCEHLGDRPIVRPKNPTAVF